MVPQDFNRRAPKVKLGGRHFLRALSLASEAFRRDEPVRETVVTAVIAVELPGQTTQSKQGR